MKKKTGKSATSAHAATRAPQRASKTARDRKTKASAAAKPATTLKKTAARRAAAPKRSGAAKPRQGATQATARKAAAKQSRRSLSPAAQKKLAIRHFQAVLKAKQLRDAQLPAWQAIEHHDHPPRRNP